jgi:hypothetical protein
LLRATHAGSTAAAGEEEFEAAGVCAAQTKFAAYRPAARIINETAVRRIGKSPGK